MSKINIITICALFVFLLQLLGCTPQLIKTDGPYFGNGFHNGWADQQSITLWTRLTALPELNKSGVYFKEISNEEHWRLRKLSNIHELHAAQIPEGYALSEMDGSCPGFMGEVKLIYHAEDDPNNRIESSWSPVDSLQNFTIQWRLDNLKSDTRYNVELLARRSKGMYVSDSITGTFKTPPPASVAESINFAVLTGHDYNRRDDLENGHKIYKSMLGDKLDFYVHTGDIEYYDKPNPWAMTEPLMRYKWDRLFALPFERNFFRQTTTYFMKDDHDVLSNDSYPGMTYGAVSFERGLEIFDKEQFPSNDSLYKTIRWGRDLQIWLVEGRNFRSKNSDPDSPQKTIWGEAQKEWFYNTINASNATFKILITSTPILGPDRERKNDNYANATYSYEGNEIRSFINSHENVYIVTGDRHWQYVSHKANSNLWEFSSGPGSDAHAGGWSEENRMPDHRFLRVKGGYLICKVYRENDTPVLKFEHRDVEGNIMNEEVFGSEY